MKYLAAFTFVLIMNSFSLGSTSCYSAKYIINLTVDRPADAIFLKKCGDKHINGLTYEDNLIKVEWKGGYENLVFDFKNKMDKPIKIKWDEAAFDKNGMGSRVIHQGIRYIDRFNPQPPTVIPKGVTISELVCPVNNITQTTGVHWKFLVKPITPESGSSEKFKKEVSKEKGTTIKILLPLVIEDVEREYLFTLKITDVRFDKYLK